MSWSMKNGQKPPLTDINRLPIIQMPGNAHRTANQPGKSWHRPLPLLQGNILDPQSLRSMGSDCAARSFYNGLSCTYMIRVTVGQKQLLDLPRRAANRVKIIEDTCLSSSGTGIYQGNGICTDKYDVDRPRNGARGQWNGKGKIKKMNVSRNLHDCFFFRGGSPKIGEYLLQLCVSGLRQKRKGARDWPALLDVIQTNSAEPSHGDDYDDIVR